MNRQTLLLNLTLTVGIIALAVLIMDKPPVDESINFDDEVNVADTTSGTVTLDTAFNPEQAKREYPNFGTAKLFQAIIPPTPTPTPTPPPPEPTPDIHAALKGWALMSISDGIVTIENKEEKDPEKQFFDITKSQGLTLTIKDSKGIDVKRKLKIKKLGEYADNPYVNFELEGSGEEHVLKQFADEANQ